MISTLKLWAFFSFPLMIICVDKISSSPDSHQQQPKRKKDPSDSPGLAECSFFLPYFDSHLVSAGFAGPADRFQKENNSHLFYALSSDKCSFHGGLDWRATKKNQNPRQLRLLSLLNPVDREFTERLLNQRSRPRKHFSLFMEKVAPGFYLATGNRYLPGPRSSYLTDVESVSRIDGIPGGRNTAITLLGAGWSGHYLGIFHLNDFNDPGYFLSGESISIFYHRRSRSGALAINHRLSFDDYYLQSVIDILKKKEGMEGYGSLSLRSRKHPVFFHIKAVRSIKDDYFDYKRGILHSSRKGRSGSAGIKTGLINSFAIELAGKDIENYGLRLMGMIFPIPVQEHTGFIFRLRRYRMADYHPSNNVVRASGVASGIYCESNTTRVELIFERRTSGVETGEFSLEYRSPNSSIIHGLKAKISLIAYLRPPDNPAFLYMDGMAERETGVWFSRREKGQMKVRITNDHIYFSLSAVPGKKAPYVILQTGFEF